MRNGVPPHNGQRPPVRELHVYIHVHVTLRNVTVRYGTFVTVRYAAVRYATLCYGTARTWVETRMPSAEGGEMRTWAQPPHPRVGCCAAHSVTASRMRDRREPSLTLPETAPPFTPAALLPAAVAAVGAVTVRTKSTPVLPSLSPLPGVACCSLR